MSENNKKSRILKVGITGGIGSGKTTVCKIFETLGIPVYYADDRAKWLMIKNLEVVNKVKKLIGTSAYFKDGKLNRGYIASIVFNDSEKLAQLNAIVHPAVFEDGNAWHYTQKDVPYTLKEAALLFEGGGYKNLDKTITVFAPKAMRIERVMNRDQVSKEAVEARMDKQWADEEKVRLADFVVINDGSKSLIPQVVEIHRKLRALQSSFR